MAQDLSDIFDMVGDLPSNRIHSYDKQVNNRYTSGSQFDWLYKTVLASGAQQPDEFPLFTTIITERRALPPGVVDPSGVITSHYPETDQFGVLSRSQRKQPPALQAGGSLDLRGFRKVMHSVLSVVQPDIRFYPAYPDYVLADSDRTTSTFPTGEVTDRSSLDQQGSEFRDTITFKVTSRLCGTLDENASLRAGGRRELKPKLRESGRRSRLYTNKLVDTYGQWFDNWVQFDLFTRTNEEAELFVEWFEDFMEVYRWIWMYAGISKMHYWERLEDKEITKWKSGLSVRSVVYYIRTEKLWEVDRYRISQINLTLWDLITNEEELNVLYEARRQRDPWTILASGLHWDT